MRVVFIEVRSTNTAGGDTERYFFYDCNELQVFSRSITMSTSEIRLQLRFPAQVTHCGSRAHGFDDLSQKASALSQYLA